jgi:hypothetical protein
MEFQNLHAQGYNYFDVNVVTSSSSISRATSIQQIINEIKKCDVLHINCYAKRHWRETHEFDICEEMLGPESKRRAGEGARTPEPAIYETAALPTELHRLGTQLKHILNALAERQKSVFDESDYTPWILLVSSVRFLHPLVSNVR